MNFLKHPALLWLGKHEKKSLPPISESLQAVFDMGNEVDKLARNIFSDGILISGYGAEAEDATKQAITEGHPAIFQAHLHAPDNTMCKIDVLVRVSDGEYDLHEVKASTKVKPEHYPDVAFQKRVAEQCGLTIRHCFVTRLNNQYVRQGKVDLEQLFATDDITKKVATAEKRLPKQIKEAVGILNLPKCPSLSPRNGGIHRFDDWMEVYFHLHPDLDPKSIYRLKRLTPDAAALLEDHGYETIDQIADAVIDELSSAQQQHVQALRKPKEVNVPAIKKFLEGLTFPLYFLDYETASHAIPFYDGTKPYQQVPFQYSLHRLDKPGGKLSHTEFLAQDDHVPVAALAKQLQQDIGNSGSVLVWYKRFETERNSEMAELLPSAKVFLETLNKRIVDLMDPFKKGYYSHPDFGGSNSLKDVYPVLSSEQSYDDLAISEGEIAQLRWRKAVFGDLDPAEQKKVFEDLLKYCKLDTLAMVKIYEHLLDVSASTKASA